MATMQGPIPNSVRRAQMMRNAWAPVGERASAALRRAVDFFAARPPLVQGVAYVMIGLWPLFAAFMFPKVAGPRIDLWLSDTISALLVVIGTTLCISAYRRQWALETVCLALGSAIALAVLDVVFVVGSRLSFGYVLDALMEIGLLALWFRGWRTFRNSRRTLPAAPLASIVPQANGVSAPQALPSAPA